MADFAPVVMDSSAVIAMIRQERGRERLAAAVERASAVAIGTPTLLECSIVLAGRYGAAGRVSLSHFLEENEAVVIPFDQGHSSVAFDAFMRFGKGRHPARLNYGDCMSYATAVVADAPLLFVGDDFSKTDVAVA